MLKLVRPLAVPSRPLRFVWCWFSGGRPFNPRHKSLEVKKLLAEDQAGFGWPLRNSPVNKVVAGHLPSF